MNYLYDREIRGLGRREIRPLRGIAKQFRSAGATISIKLNKTPDFPFTCSEQSCSGFSFSMNRAFLRMKTFGPVKKLEMDRIISRYLLRSSLIIGLRHVSPITVIVIIITTSVIAIIANISTFRCWNCIQIKIHLKANVLEVFFFLSHSGFLDQILTDTHILDKQTNCRKQCQYGRTRRLPAA